MSPPGQEPRRLVVDSMLGRLARWLRLLGFDAPLVKTPPLHIMPGEVLLTRRRKLRGRENVLFIEYDRLEDQLAQVLGELALAMDPAKRFTRCGDCNQPVEAITREQAMGRVPEFILHSAQGFTACPACAKVFWPGSHGRRFEKLMKGILVKQREHK